MFEKLKAFFSKVFFMSEEEYEEALSKYAAKFQLQQKWVIQVVEKLPDVQTNYSNKDEVLGFTDWVSHKVVFKHALINKPKFLVRAFIRHELRHCQQMEWMNVKMKEKYGGDLANIYTQILIAGDNIKGYNKSLMEQDAWLAFCGIYINIEKVVNRIIKRNAKLLLEE